MKTALLLCFVAVAVSTVQGTGKAMKGHCHPGDCFMKKNRVCPCPANGMKKSLFCYTPQLVYIGRILPGIGRRAICSCEPGTEFISKDLRCTCQENGMLTVEDCRRIRPGTKAETISDSLEETCRPGEKFPKVCKTCLSPSYGATPPRRTRFKGPATPPQFLRRKGIFSAIHAIAHAVKLPKFHFHGR